MGKGEQMPCQTEAKVCSMSNNSTERSVIAHLDVK